MSVSLKPVSAILDKDTDTVGKAVHQFFNIHWILMSYLCSVKRRRKASNVKMEAKKPHWSESFDFSAKDTLLNVEVWDKDTFSPDDLVLLLFLSFFFFL